MMIAHDHRDEIARASMMAFTTQPARMKMAMTLKLSALRAVGSGIIGIAGLFDTFRTRRRG